MHNGGVSERDRRNHLEALQTERVSLERERHEGTVALAAARMAADEAEARLDALQRHYDALKRETETARPPTPVVFAGSALLTLVFVFAVFSAVIGCVVVAVHSYRVSHASSAPRAGAPLP